MRFVKVIISTVIVLLGVVFIIENLEMLKLPVRLKLDLYVITFQSPDVHLWVLVLFAFFLGVFTASLYGIYEHYHQRQTIRQLRHNLEVVAKELGIATAHTSKAAHPPEAAPEPQVAPQSE